MNTFARIVSRDVTASINNSPTNNRQSSERELINVDAETLPSSRTGVLSVSQGQASSQQGGQRIWNPGDVIFGRYEMVKQIGLGGMGSVWKVHHREWGRDLALKMPLPALLEHPALRERFIREAETWVGLGVHPNIVQCWYVLNIDGVPCLFLDFLTGGSLKDRAQEGLIGPGRWVEIIEASIQIAQGLEHSHSRGVIHRDVKPENLLFRDDGRVCVTDFGLVKTAMPESVVEETGLTALQSSDPSVSGFGAYLGTPQYGAPEQWGAAERVGPAADIYAFGITLYELCCGRRPFDDDKTAVHFGVLIDAHLKTPPPDPREFYPEVPETLALFCLSCLEKEPTQRPPSMNLVAQFLAELRGRLTGVSYSIAPVLPNTENPDILNNTAVSLHSLGRNEDARRIWRRALRQESAHPECLYNLAQVEHRDGDIGSQEVLRRLQQAKANYPLGLFCIEQGLGKEAVTVLTEINTEEPIKKGLVQRALGDASMYTQQYFAAEKAYQAALKLMPKDEEILMRKQAAAIGRRQVGNEILFPSSDPRFKFASGHPEIRLLVEADSSMVLGVTDSEFLLLDTSTEQITTRVPRLADARPVARAWIHSQRVVLQEQGAFQLRLLPDLQLVGRMGGRILALAPDLSRLVVLNKDGPSLFSAADNSFLPIGGAAPDPAGSRLLAAFDASGALLSLLLTSGELAHLNAELQAVPADWPSPFAQPKDPTALALSRNGVVYIGYASGEVHGYDVARKVQTFAIQLPGPIHSLELHAQDQTLIASLGNYFFVLDSLGKTLWQGRGPLTTESGGDRMLAFSKGVLHLYERHPFHSVRHWSSPVENPRGLELGQNGGLAVSWNDSGNVQVWEVDEKHRVYERSLLVSPGQSYDDLVRGAQAFPEAMAQAVTALHNKQLLECYRQLLKARAISGYGQTPAALDLNWSLLERMGRDQLDAIWDRQSLSREEEPGPVDISGSGDLVTYAFGTKISLVLDSVAETKTLWEQAFEEKIVAARFQQAGSERSPILFLNINGNGGYLDPADGRVSKNFSLGVGPLVAVKLADQSVLFTTEDSRIGSFDLNACRITSISSPFAEPVKDVFPWHSSQAIVVTKAGYGVVSLGKKPASALSEFSSKGYQPGSPVTFATLDTQHRVLILGLKDGTLAITDANNGRLLYAIAKVSSAVTGFVLVSKLSMGIVATERGHLYFWDLLADKALEGILAHRGGITDLKVDASGRYLVTAGRDRQVRIWETSWTASLSLEEKPQLDWLPKASAMSKLTGFFRRG